MVKWVEYYYQAILKGQVLPIANAGGGNLLGVSVIYASGNIQRIFCIKNL